MSDAASEALRLAAEAEETPEVPQQPDTLWLSRQVKELARLRAVRADNAKAKDKALREVAEEWDAADAQLAKDEEKLEGWVRDYCRAFRDVLLPPGKKSRALPGGTVAFKQPARELEVEDSAALLAWCKAQPNADELVLVTRTEKPAKAEVKKHFSVGTPPGCRWVVPDEEFEVKTGKEKA